MCVYGGGQGESEACVSGRNVPETLGWASSGPPFLMALIFGASPSRGLTFTFQEEPANSSEPAEEVGGTSGAAESLEARADAGGTITILVVGSLQAGAESSTRLSL